MWVKVWAKDRALYLHGPRFLVMDNYPFLITYIGRDLKIARELCYAVF